MEMPVPVLRAALPCNIPLDSNMSVMPRAMLRMQDCEHGYSRHDVDFRAADGQKDSRQTVSDRVAFLEAPSTTGWNPPPLPTLSRPNSRRRGGLYRERPLSTLSRPNSRRCGGLYRERWTLALAVSYSTRGRDHTHRASRLYS